MSSNPLKVSEHCSNGSSKTYQLAKIAKFNLSSECFLEMPNSIVYSSMTFQKDLKIDHYLWPLSFENIFHDIKPKTFSDFISNSTLHSIDPTLIRAFHDLQKDKSHKVHLTHWSILSTASISVIALVAVFLFISIYCFLKSRKNTLYKNVPQK